MSKEDLWGKAVVCAKAARTTSDPHKRAVLIRLGELWLDLARNDTSQISETTALDIAVMERVQAEILGVRPTFH